MAEVDFKPFYFQSAALTKSAIRKDGRARNLAKSGGDIRRRSRARTTRVQCWQQTACRPPVKAQNRLDSDRRRNHSPGAAALEGAFVAIELPGKPHGTRLELAQIMSDSPEVTDAYDSLLGSLRLARSLESGNSILVTSTEPGEGKTTVSMCLAVTAARAGQTALLIDGDLRRPSLRTAVGGADTVGLIEILLGQAEAAEAIRPVDAVVGSVRAGAVSFMPGGRKPSSSLGGVDWFKARAAFKSVSQAFGMVFLDSPPILAVNDALLLAGLVDAVLLVVGAGKANLDEIRQAKAQLDTVGTPIVGAVLNRFEPKVHGPSKRPYSGYYRGSRP